MSQPHSKSNLVGAFAYPALTLFLIPTFALIICYVSFPKFEQQIIARFDRAIVSTPGLGGNQRQRLFDQLHKTSAWSLINKENPDFRRWDSELRPLDIPTYLLYRGIGWLSWGCIGLGLVSFLVVGLSASVTPRSHKTLYRMLKFNWHFVSMVGLLELIAQTTVVVGVISLLLLGDRSFFVALLLVLVVGTGIVSVTATAATLFGQLDPRRIVPGVLVERDDAPQFWNDLERLCGQVGTEPPDHVIAGIQDGFWVTQSPIILPVDDAMRKTLRGRTLYVSLPLLKVLPGREADALLLHEMAHFSGNDTFYTEKISPLFRRHVAYLDQLQQNWLTLPIYHFAMLPLVVSQIALSQIKREREFRADRIAAAYSSPEDFAFGLMRIVAFATFRNQCENEAFYAEAIHENGSIAQSLSDGLRPFVETFFEDHPIGELTSPHPFDSHPPLHLRLEAIGLQADKQTLRYALADNSVGPWYEKIDNAAAIENSQWSSYEAAFQQQHEAQLVYHLLPSDDQERAIVEKYFPPLRLYVAYGRALSVDYEKLSFELWEHEIYFREVVAFDFMQHDQTWIEISYRRLGIPLTAKIPLTNHDTYQHAQVLEAIESYSNRSDYAHAYQREQSATCDGETDLDFGSSAVPLGVQSGL